MPRQFIGNPGHTHLDTLRIANFNGSIHKNRLSSSLWGPISGLGREYLCRCNRNRLPGHWVLHAGKEMWSTTLHTNWSETRMNPTIEARYTSKQAAIALQCTDRHVDRLLRRLGFEPTIGGRGSGNPRRWSLADIVAVRMGACWMQQGISWMIVRKAIQRIKQNGLEPAQECPVMVVNGDSISMTQPGSLRLALQGEPVLAYDLRSCLEEVRSRLSDLPQEEPKQPKHAEPLSCDRMALCAG